MRRPWAWLSLSSAIIAWSLWLAPTETLANPVVEFQRGMLPHPFFPGVADTTLRRGSVIRYQPTGNYDGSRIPLRGSPIVSKALLRWDLSSLASSTTVQSARVLVHVFRNPSAARFNAYELKRPWVESQATWLEYATGQAWGTPGASAAADRGSVVLGTFSPPAEGFQSFSLNASGVALVQAWVNGSTPNYGLLLENLATADETTIDNMAYSTLSRRPALEVSHSGSAITLFQNEVSPSTGYLGGADTFIVNGPAPQDANWNGPDMYLDGNGDDFSMLFRVDLSSVPSTAIVRRAVLHLTSFATDGSTDTYPVFRSTQPWTESGATFTLYDGASPWNLPGGEGPLDQGVQVGTIDNQPDGLHSVSLNAAGVALVQAWILGGANNGFHIENYANNAGAMFHGSESPSGAARPRLELELDVPYLTATPSVFFGDAGETAGPATLRAFLSDGGTASLGSLSFSASLPTGEFAVGAPSGWTNSGVVALTNGASPPVYVRSSATTPTLFTATAAGYLPGYLSWLPLVAAPDGGTSDGGTPDGGTSDGGTSDGGTSDGGTSDGGTSDGGASDGGTSDGGTSDGGTSDGGTSDGGTSDGGASDGGATDGGATDGGASDGGATDGGVTDGGATDGGTSDGGDSAARPPLNLAVSCGCAGGTSEHIVAALAVLVGLTLRRSRARRQRCR